MFIETRRRNFHTLYEGLRDLEKFFILPVIPEKADPSPFGFILTVKDDAPFTRAQIITYLEGKGIQTRMVFAGNIVRQPAMEGVIYRQVGDLRNTDKVMNDAFWIGVYPGLKEEMIEFMIKKIKEFIEKHRSFK
jgi:CDP-6-deoxy-D-xylo-4-hexulose-3-dehydrase